MAGTVLPGHHLPLPMSIVSQREALYRDVNQACADLFGANLQTLIR